MLLAAEGRGKRDGEQGVIRREGEGRGHDGGADGAGDEGCKQPCDERRGFYRCFGEPEKSAPSVNSGAIWTLLT